MRQTQFKEVIILSAELSKQHDLEKRHNTYFLENSLKSKKIVYNKSTGVYKNLGEQSFVTLPKNDREIAYIKSVAFSDFNQESILYQDKRGDAYLIYSDGTKESIGKLRKVNSSLGLENYTIMNNEIYATI